MRSVSIPEMAKGQPGHARRPVLARAAGKSALPPRDRGDLRAGAGPERCRGSAGEPGSGRRPPDQVTGRRGTFCWHDTPQIQVISRRSPEAHVGPLSRLESAADRLRLWAFVLFGQFYSAQVRPQASRTSTVLHTTCPRKRPVMPPCGHGFGGRNRLPVTREGCGRYHSRRSR
jgi:hypothetical protein